MPNNEQIKRILPFRPYSENGKIITKPKRRKSLADQIELSECCDWEVKNVRSNQWEKERTKRDVYYAVCIHTHTHEHIGPILSVLLELDFCRDLVSVVLHRISKHRTVHGTQCARCNLCMLCSLYGIHIKCYCVSISIFSVNINNGRNNCFFGIAG